MANALTVNDQTRTKPCLPAPLERLIEMGTEHRFESDPQFDGDTRSRRVPISRWEPPRLGPQTVNMITEALRQYEVYLAPADRAQVSARIATLLAHYYVPDMPASLQTAVMSDWLDELAEFPAWAIQQACRAWLRREKRKPSLADIISLCNDAMHDARTERTVLQRCIKNCGLGPAQSTEITILGAG